jgi:hypothetical protein
MVRATDLQWQSSEPRSRSRGMLCNGVDDHPSTTPSAATRTSSPSSITLVQQYEFSQGSREMEPSIRSPRPRSILLLPTRDLLRFSCSHLLDKTIGMGGSRPESRSGGQLRLCVWLSEQSEDVRLKLGGIRSVQASAFDAGQRHPPGHERQSLRNDIQKSDSGSSSRSPKYYALGC